MKRLFVFIILLLISMLIFAQTQVSGNQSGTWTSDNSPYQVVGDIMVTSANALTIESGVTVDFQGHYQFKIQGNLQAIGTEADSIFFTTDNQAIGWGGIRFDSANGMSNLSYCRIEFGKTSGEYPDIHGGGLALLSSDAVISNCVFADNDATGSEDGMGGAVYAINTGSPSGALTRFINCKFIRNHAYGEGGAIKFTSDMHTEITGCEFIGNNCFYGGGAISFYSVFETKMINCLFANNFTEYSSGGALHTLGMDNSIILENCTISGNSANHGDGGAISLAYASANIVNTIIYGNQGMYSDGIYIDIGSSAEINYSDLTMPSEASGSHNINQTPLFVDNFDFHLSPLSPCIDAGTMDLPQGLELPEYDLEGNPRIVDGMVDIGAYEYQGTSAHQNEIPMQVGSSLNVYPNPFSLNSLRKAELRFELNLPETGEIKLEIYNLKGQKVKTLMDAFASKGKHLSKWDGKNDQNKFIATGTYFAKVILNNKAMQIKEFVVVK